MRKVVLGFLCAMVFCIPFEEMAAVEGLETIIFDLGCVSLVLAVFTALRRRLKTPSPAFGILAFYVVLSFTSALWALQPDEAIRGSKTNLELLVFAWMVWEFASEEDRAFWLFRAYILGCCVSLAGMFSAYAAGAQWMMATESEYRFQGGGLNENFIATVLDLSIAMAIYLAGRTGARRSARLLYWAYVPAAVLGVFLSGSRAGIIALCAGLVMIAITLSLRRTKTAVALMLSVGSAAAFLPRIVPEGVFQRLAEGSRAETFQIRIQLWKAGFQYFADHPFFGCGTYNFKFSVSPRAGEVLVAHNTFISLLVEGGLVGFLTMTAFWFYLARMGSFLERDEKLFWLTLFAIWGICAMSLTWETNKTTWLLYSCLMARFASLRRPLRRQAAA
ncbi:MAG: O-antigen ligase family protein [Elusimicrobia bacterium]|nr:O-antigen ligase family protein [Elusimicrobiota bacterium]